MERVTRPEADKKKISCKEEFELCYLRHQYVRKTEYNPSQEDMAPYRMIIRQQARNTYFTYPALFSQVGMEVEDIENIARVHLVSYLGLFAVEVMPAKQEAFERNFEVQKGYSPFKDDTLDKNKANFTIFLKQRMEDVVRVCRQKVRNIKGFPGDEHYVYVGEKKPPNILGNLMEDHEKYGYKKLDIAVFKTIRKRAGKQGLTSFQFNGLWYISLKHTHESLSMNDFRGAGLDPYDSIHNMTPERLYFDQQEDQFWQEKRVEFDAYEPNKRAKLLKRFLAKNRNKVAMKEEVRLAKKLLRDIGE